MAELRVEPKRGRGVAWMWIIVVLLIIAAVAYWLWSSGRLPTGGARADSARDSVAAPATSPGT